ncbi:hypothetical protein PO909_017575 [Leuciscus waleckii]
MRLSYLRTPFTDSLAFLCSSSTSFSSLIQTVLQVLDGLVHVLLHALQMSTGVLLLLQLLCHHGSISDGLLGFFLSIPALLHCLLNLSLKLSIISLQLLLLIQQTGVLNMDNIDIHIVF